MSDIETIKDVFGDVLQGTAPITSNNASGFKDELLTQSVRSFFIIVEARKIKEELKKNSHSTLYRDLLKAATGCAVGKNVSLVSQARVRLLPSGRVLGKGFVLSHSTLLHLNPIFSPQTSLVVVSHKHVSKIVLQQLFFNHFQTRIWYITKKLFLYCKEPKRFE